MKLSTVMLMPWRASPRSSNIFAMAIVALLLIGVLSIAYFAPSPVYAHTVTQAQAEWMLIVGVLAFGEVFLWASWFGGTLLLALHASRLRLPGVQRHVVAALAFYALLTVMLPAAVVGALSYGVVTTVCVLGLAAAAGSLAALMPIYTYFVLWIGGLAINASPLVLGLPSPGDHLFVPCALLALAGVLVAAVARWWQLLRHPEVRTSPWRKPIVMQLRMDTRCRPGLSLHAGHGRPTGTDLNTLIRRRPDWMQPRANLAHVGPQHPVAGLRVALGGMFMPVTRRAWLARTAAWLLPLSVLLVVLALGDVDHGSIDSLWRSIFSDTGLRGVVPLATFAAAIIGGASTVYVQHYWRQRLDDLALLALLPCIGPTDRVKSDALRSALIVPLRLQVALLVVSLAAAWATGAGVGGYLLVLAPQLAVIAYVAAATVATMGGVPMAGSDTASFVRRAGNVAAATIAGLLFTATVILQMFGTSHATDMSMMILCACWGALCVAMMWVGRHGWRALQQRPHVFLPN